MNRDHHEMAMGSPRPLFLILTPWPGREVGDRSTPPFPRRGCVSPSPISAYLRRSPRQITTASVQITATVDNQTDGLTPDSPPTTTSPELQHLYVSTPAGSCFTLLGGEPVPDGPDHLLLVNPGGKVLFRVPKEWVTRSTPEQTAARIAEDTKRRKADIASRN